MRWVTWGFVGYYLLTGFYIAVLPEVFYLNAPGVEATGPYNMHFVRDVGFAFLTSAAAIAYGLYRHDKAVMVFGAVWLLVHALFHLGLWVIHGLTSDEAALVDALLVWLPGIAVFVVCVRHDAGPPADVVR